MPYSRIHLPCDTNGKHATPRPSGAFGGLLLTNACIIYYIAEVPGGPQTQFWFFFQVGLFRVGLAQ